MLVDSHSVVAPVSRGGTFKREFEVAFALDFCHWVLSIHIIIELNRWEHQLSQLLGLTLGLLLHQVDHRIEVIRQRLNVKLNLVVDPLSPRDLENQELNLLLNGHVLLLQVKGGMVVHSSIQTKGLVMVMSDEANFLLLSQSHIENSRIWSESLNINVVEGGHVEVLVGLGNLNVLDRWC